MKRIESFACFHAGRLSGPVFSAGRRAHVSYPFPLIPSYGDTKPYCRDIQDKQARSTKGVPARLKITRPVSDTKVIPWHRVQCLNALKATVHKEFQQLSNALRMRKEGGHMPTPYKGLQASLKDKLRKRRPTLRNQALKTKRTHNSLRRGQDAMFLHAKGPS